MGAQVKLEVGSTWSCDDQKRPAFNWTISRLDETTVYLDSPCSRTAVNRRQFVRDVKEGKMWLVTPPDKHPREFRFGFGTKISDVAEQAAGLHYETLARFLEHLADCLDDDSNADDERGRRKLAKALFHASLGVREASHCILVASRIKPKKEKHRGKKT